MELKSKVIKGFAWNTLEKVLSTLVGAYVSIKVANRLFPEDYAAIGILVALLTVFNTFVDSGLSQALIRKKDPSETDYSSAFYFNIGISAAVYGLLIVLSFPAARIFDMPELTRIAPVLYLVVPLNALIIIQQTVLTRNFRFRRLSSINFATTVGAGAAAILLAVNGFGVWALVGLRVVQMALRTLLLWIFGTWKPAGVFSAASIRGMFGYSSRLLATDLINNVYNNIPQFVLGRYREILGNYEMARKLKDLPVAATMNSMQAVTFPALSRIKDDDPHKFADSVSRVIASIVFLMFPVMTGLIVVADDFFGIFLRIQWHGAIPFFRILCLTGLMIPVTIISNNILKTRSDGKALVRAEILKKALATVIFASTIPFGALSITWGMVGIAFTDMAVSFSLGRRYSDYGLRRLARDVTPALLLTAVMAVTVWGTGWLIADWQSPWPVMGLKISVGAAVYFAGAWLLRLQGLAEFLEIVRKILRIN